jgi:2-polyprenyl-6-methoxyphenol hydroxylase-like FAD-dependent oxidoreductase
MDTPLIDHRAEPNILIVGAGPTGLTLALALRRMGVACTVIDAKAGPSTDSKGLSVNLASQTALAAFGLGADQLSASGSHIRRVSFSEEGRRLSSVDLERAVPGARLVTQPQSLTEAALLSALGKADGEVQWNTRLTTLKAGDEDCLAEIQQADGQVQRRRFRFAVGCDGKRSVVRQALGIDMVGCDYPCHFILGDFPRPAHVRTEEVHYHLLPDGFLLFVPIGPEQVRVVVSRQGQLDREDSRPAASIANTVNAHFGHRVIDGPPSWASSANFYMRQVQHLRRGPGFLCGDAAHLVSPVGGTGMNMGIADALDLAWRLAYRVRAIAPPGVLDGYERERSELIRRTIHGADLSTRYMSALERSPGAEARLAPRIGNRQNLRADIPCLLLGIHPAYPKARREGDPSVLARSVLPVAGRMRAQLAALDEDANSIASILAVSTPASAAQAAEWRRDLNNALAAVAWLKDALTLVVFGPAGCVEKAVPHGCVFVDDAALQSACCLGPSMLLLLRPDSVIAFGGRMSQTGALRQAVAAQYGIPASADAGNPSTPLTQKEHA